VHARREPACAAAIGMIAMVAFVASPFIALVPVMAQHLSGGGGRAVAATTALLTTAQGVGAVVGALLLAPLAGWIGRGRALLVSLALLPVTLAGYATSASPWWGAATLFAVGLVYIGVLSGLSTVVQLRAPQAYRGRVLSFFLVALGVSYPIGSLVQGPVIDRIGIGWTTAGTAVLLLVILGAIAIWRPGVFRALAADSRAADSRAADSPGPGPGEGAPGPDQPDSVGESQSTVDSR
nr:MFS transporter [Actinomycetota bacterium]